jgi:arylsulfatase A-like enzyme
MFTRREMLAGVGAAVPRRAAAASKPNFLFLIADDHAAYEMGCDGNALAETPNLDRFSGEGTRFSRAYCNSPVCTPSRQSFFTGLLPHATGVTRLPTPLRDEAPTLSKRLKQAGYTTGVIGKMHLHRSGPRGFFGFDHVVTEYELDRRWREEVRPKPVPEGIRTKPAWRPFKDPARIWLNSEKLPYPRFDADMRSTFQTRLVEQFLEQKRSTPFALWVSFTEPHSPYDFPIEDRDAMSAAKFTPPRVGPRDASQIPLIFRDLTDAEKCGIIAACYTSVRYLDHNVGRVLDTLRRLKLDENTLVVYLGDNGYQLGHHGRFEKHCGYEQSLRVPLIVRWPGKVRRGVTHELVELVDVPATVTDMLGVEPLAGIHGHSLRPYLEGRAPSRKRDHIFSEYLENEEAYIRTERWKLIHCSGKRERGDGYKTDKPTPGRYTRLFDLREDPGEFHDLSAKRLDVVAQLGRVMLDRFRQTHPEAAFEPARLSQEEALDWYVHPRDV